MNQPGCILMLRQRIRSVEYKIIDISKTII